MSILSRITLKGKTYVHFNFTHHQFDFTTVHHNPSVRCGLSDPDFLPIPTNPYSPDHFDRHLFLSQTFKIGTTMNFINSILDLIDIEDLTEENISEAIRTQACLLAGLDPEEFCNH